MASVTWPPTSFSVDFCEALHGQILSFVSSYLDSRGAIAVELRVKTRMLRDALAMDWLWLGAGCGSSWLADPVSDLRPPSSTRPYLLVRIGLLREEGQQGHRLTAAAARKSAKTITRKSTNSERCAAQGELAERTGQKELGDALPRVAKVRSQCG